MLTQNKQNSCLLLIIFSMIIFTGCTSEEPQKEALDYDAIPLIELQEEFSITESENYIPAWIDGMFLTDSGDLLVSERAEKAIHQFDTLGNYIAQVARSGRGPGELSQNANPHFNGQILVMSNNNGMLTEYRPNDEGIYEYSTDHTFRLPGVLRGIHSIDDFSVFYVSVDSARVPFGTIPPEFTTEFIHLVQVVGDSLEVEEEILSLKKHSAYVQITDGGNSMLYNSLPYRYSDYLTPLPGKRFMVKRPSKSVIQIYGENLDLEYELKLNVKDRLVTEADMDYHFPDLNHSERRDRRELIRDVKPPFSGVLLDNKNRFWLQTDANESGREYVVLSYEGDPLGRVMLPSESVLHEVYNDKLYLVNREPETRIDVYSVQL